MGKIIKFIIIAFVALAILGAAAFWGLAGFFAPKDMEESLIPDAASQFLILTAASSRPRLRKNAVCQLLSIKYRSTCSRLLSLSKITDSMNTAVSTSVVRPVLYGQTCAAARCRVAVLLPSSWPKTLFSPRSVPLPAR